MFIRRLLSGTNSAEKCFTRLTSQMGPGIVPLPGNEELETAYLRYEAATLDAEYGRASNYFRFDDLPRHERDQAHAMVEHLTCKGLASAALLRRRLQRMRFLEVDSCTRQDKEVGGAFDNGLATIAKQTNSIPRTPEQQNYARIHEIAHGLTAISEIALMGSHVGHFGIGLRRKRILATTRDPQAISRVHVLDEAVVDTLAVSVSKIDKEKYLAGEYPHVGYWKEDNALAALTASNPELATEIWRKTFSTSLQSRDQALTYANAYAEHLPQAT